ncbi:MAG: molybdenum cofactor guanylyltransferase, partial [Gemmatimonadota bacterium]|nr:molybdenum cofactor guanylyltransferase [Gemmatimonadota bacterium]
MLPDPFPDAGSPLAAILAGGASRRFGAPKGLARIGERTLVARIAEAAHGAHLEAVLITSEPERYTELALRSRPDLLAGVGPLGGIHAALRWAEDEGRPGVLVLPCDAPFLSAGLLRAIVEFAEGAEAVLPESTGPRGVEPLCAFYSVRCIAHVEA